MLDVEDILALCFAFSKDPRRLKVYLDVLRGKSGVKAQAAACLICFDLARQGDPRFEAEFMALIPVMADLAQSPQGGGTSLADALIGKNDYLQALWGDLKARLEHLDPRSDPEVVEVTDGDALEVSLFDAADLAELGLEELDALSTDNAALREQWMEALDRFCLWDPDGATARADAPPGFYADHKADLQRLEQFQLDASSLHKDVPAAHEMLPVISLFLACHTRARNIFGKRNKQRDAHLQEGLELFSLLDRPPEEATAWLMEPTAAPFAWEKVAEMLLDYVAFLGRLPKAERLAGAEHTVRWYLQSNRPQPPPTVLAKDARERRRR